MKLKIWAAAVKETFQQHYEKAAEIADAGISALAESEALNDIPVIGTGLKVLEARDTFSEIRFRRNCVALLKACEHIDEGAKREAMDTIAADVERFEDFADTLMIIATESSKPFKAEIVGNLLAAMIKGQIDYRSYNDLVHIVHSASIPALSAVRSYFESQQGSSSTQRSVPREEPLLISTGLASRFGTKFTVSDEGSLLYRFGFVKDDLYS